MKKLILFATILVPAIAQAGSTYVNSYYRNDGTLVQGHYRTTPNNTRLDNWSTRGNVNPYTGQRGYENPYELNKGSGFRDYSNE